MTVEDQYSGATVISNNLSATITNVNINGSMSNYNHTENGSVNSSMSSSSSSCSILQQQALNMKHNLNQQTSNKTHSMLNISERENDSGIEKDDSNMIFVRISITDQNVQKVLKFGLNELVGHAKQRVLATLNKEIKDGLNYGLYQPPFQGRAGKFLDDCRQLKEYSLSGPVANLEFKYKKRVYKFVKINQKELKALNVKSNFKRFLDLVRTNQVSKVNRFLEKGLDPNFHSDLGETPLTIAASLAEPRSMIMTLYNGGAHLDFRSRDTLTPMHKAATIGNDKALKTLLELGAFAEVRDGRQLTPLYYSIVNASSVQSIEYLLFNGSSIGVHDDNNWHEIHHACKLGLSQHLDHLIYYGSDINSKNNSGNTPLHICAIHNQENCARILLFRGCDRQERNLANQTAFESAIIAGNQLIADLIKNHHDSETVPIRDRPFYNTKRRSIYVDSNSNYSMSLNGNASINSSMNSYGTATRPSKNTKSTLTSLATTHTLLGWNESVNNSSNNSIREAQNGTALSATLRSQSMPKLLDENDQSKNQKQNSTHSRNGDLPPSAVSSNILINSEGSSSPTSRSRSISSDDHGFGSASLSNMSGSPNIEYSHPRKRLYSSIPKRTFICVKPFKPTQVGEMELKKGDLIEVFSVGDSGYWEGRCVSTACEGWFKSACVEEFILPDNDSVDSIALKRKTLLDLIQHCDLSALRTVVLQRGRKGFGFVLRGAKTNDIKFEPTPEVPALQFLESVDKDSNADKAGLKPLDFVLEINNIDVTCRTHAECVKLIKKTGDTLALKVYTVNNRNTLNLIQSSSSNLASSNLASIYQTPNSLMNKQVASISASQTNLSTSYYATTQLATNQSEETDTNSTSKKKYTNVMDGTKSLPHKKKRKQNI